MNKRHFGAVILVVSLAALGIWFHNLTPVENVTHTTKVVSSDTSPSDAPKNSLSEQSKNIVHIDDLVAEDCGSATLFFTSLPAKCLVNGKLITIEGEPELEIVYQENGIRISRNPDYDGK